MAPVLEKIKDWGGIIATGISILVLVLALGVRFSDTGLDAHFYRKLEDPQFERAVGDIVEDEVKDLATKQDIEHLKELLLRQHENLLERIKEEKQ